MERMSAAAEKLDQSFSSQVDTVTKLAAAFGTAGTADTVQRIEAMGKSFQTASENVKDTGNTSEEAFSKMGKGIKKAGEEIGKKFPKSVIFAAGALSGLKQSGANVIAMGKGLIDFTTGLVDGLVSVASSIIAIPFKMFTGLVDMAAKSAGGSNELAVAMEKLRKEFGHFTGPTNKAIISTSVNLKGFSDTGLSAWRVFGTLAERLEAMGELAKEMGGAFNLVRKEFEDNGGALLAYKKGLGLSNEAMKAVTQRGITMGEKLGDTLKETTKYSLDLGKAFQLDAKLISRDMTKAMQDVAHFAGATVKQIGEASTYARKLGVELKDITGTLDAFETFDSAADNVSKMSQAFGVNADAMELMSAQNPAEIIDSLRKSFAAAGVDSSKFDRQNTKLLTTMTGLDAATAKQVFSAKNQGVSLDAIKKKSSESEKKTLSQADAMSQLSGAIERMTKPGGAMSGGFMDQFIKGFLGGIQASTEFRKIMMNIRQALRETEQAGVRLGKAFVATFPGVKDFLGGIADFFDPAKFRKLTGGVVDVLKVWMNGLTSNDGSASFAKLMDNIQEKFFDFFDASSPSGQKVIGGFKTFLKTFSTIIAEGIKMLIPKVIEGLKSLTELITNPAKFMAAASSRAAGGASSGMAIVAEILDPIIKALDNPAMMTKLWHAIGGLASILWDKLYELVIKGAKEMPTKVWLGVGAIMFGPTLGRALLGAGISALGSVFKKIFIESAEKALIDKAVAATFAKTTSSLVESGVSAASKTATDAVAKGASGAASGGAGVSKMASLLANPYVLVAVAALAITVGAFALAKTSMKGEAEKLQDALDDEDWLKKLEDKSKTVDERIDMMKLERLKHMKKADEEAGAGILNFIRGGMSEQEADARAKAGSIEKQLQAEKLKKDRELIVGTPEYQAKMKLAADENKKRILDAMGPVTIENAAEKFKKVGDLAKQVTGKDFDLAEKMKMIRDKLDSVDFSIFGSKEKEDKLNLALSALSSVKALFGVIGDVGQLSAKATSSIKMIDNKELKTAFESLQSFGNTVMMGIADMKFIERLQLSATYSKSAAVNIAAIAENLKTTSTAMNEIAKAMKEISTRVTDVSNITPQKVGDQAIEAVGKNLAIVEKIQTKIGQATNSPFFLAFGSTVQKFTSTIKGSADNKEGISGALLAVSEMVKQANDLNNALASSGNVIDIKAKLERVAGALSLGGKTSYSVNAGKNVEITVNLAVEINAADIEKAIIMRESSQIRKRLDWATFDHVGKKTTQNTEQSTRTNTPLVEGK